MGKKNFKDFKKALLLSYSQIFFSYDEIIGFFLLILTFFSPWIAISGLFGVIISNLTAYAFNYNPEHIKKGYYGFNSLLIAMETAYFFDPSLPTFILLFTVVVSTLFLTVVLNHIFYLYLGIPPLTLPFVLMSIIFYFATYNYTGLPLRDFGQTAFNSIPFLKSEIPEMFFKSLSIIFFQNRIEVGIIISLIMLFYSPTMLFLSITSFVLGVKFYLLMGGSLTGTENAFVGFNFIFVGIATGGIFFVPSVYSFLLAIFTVLITALISSGIKTFVIFYKMPVFALPFNLVIFMILIAFKQRGKDQNPKFVDFIPGKPEDNLNYYIKNIKRFGSFFINKNLKLPVKGVWKISQGADGKETHKDRWRWALDFQKTTCEGKVYENDGNSLQDYPTYKEKVYSPANGTIVMIQDDIKDNKIGEVNTKENWGNFIIINTGYGIYIKLAHLLKESIKVKIGQKVKAGDMLAEIGNSGRSSYPHLHFQVQNLPIVGSDTIPFSFYNYILHKNNNKTEIIFKKLPQEGDIIENIESKENISEIFNLYINRKFTYKFKNNHEEIIVDIDFYGRKFLKSDNKARLYFTQNENFFYFFDFEGNKKSLLYYIYQSISVIPLYYKENLEWEEKIYFPKENTFKNFYAFFHIFLPLPYKKFNYRYGKKVKYKGKLSYLIYINDKKTVINEDNFIASIKEEENFILESE